MPYHREEEREREKCRGVNEWDFKFACGKRAFIILDELFVPAQSGREREREKRLLIKLSFTRVNYPDGMSGKLIAIVEALFAEPPRV